MQEFWYVEGFRLPRDTPQEALPYFVDALTSERQRAATSCLMSSDRGQLSSPWADDHAGAQSHDGRAAVARRWSQVSLGSDGLSDLRMSVDEMVAVASDPNVRFMPPQLYVADRVEGLANIGESHPRSASDRVESLCWSPDGSRVAFLEFRGPYREDNLAYWVWEENVATKQRRVLGGLPGDSWWFGSVSYSSDGRWLLVENGDGDTRLLELATML